MKTTVRAADPILEETLRQYFGYDTFRAQQKDIITQVLEGKDAVVLMPTGGGKSLCYQLPAVLLEGLTVVISPLIALMKDQVQALQGNGIAAACLNSSLTDAEERQVREDLQAGNVKLLYVSPERLLSPHFLDYLEGLSLSLFAIDEAHCVSSWGHHFRPDYRQLDVIKQRFQNIPVIALTATADKAVRSDIGELLRLRDPQYFIASFDRPNLSLAVLPGRKKWEQLQRLLARYPGQNGIIYCSSRAATEKLAAKLVEQGLQAACYHAGLDSAVRSRTQDDFIHGQTHIICATIAFGMGIDKADVRFVVHYNLPGNLESYYQEIGRAGRDGDPSETILFYSYRDVQTQLGFLNEVDDPQYKEIQLAKLQRMQQYAEAQVCRRNILLSYFSEMPGEPCGNCDVCRNPPEYFDGTVHAQMALSALSRLKEQVSLTTLIDVLKGTYSATVRENGYERIKTFAAGRHTSAFAWQLFMQQLLQQGLLEVDYKDHYNLKLTPLSREVLFQGRTVQLVTPETIKERQEAQKKTTVKAPKSTVVNEPLFDHLRELRKTIATRIRKPAYVVFSDAALQDMAGKMPGSEQEFLQVHGVGEHKAKRYAKVFLEAIAEFRERS